MASDVVLVSSWPAPRTPRRGLVAHVRLLAPEDLAAVGALREGRGLESVALDVVDDTPEDFALRCAAARVLVLPWRGFSPLGEDAADRPRRSRSSNT
jgi:hypothetical protein